MANKENSMLGKRLANAYLSSVVSIALVLLLVGVASLLLVNARGISNYFKENMKVSVLMKQEVEDVQAAEYLRTVEAQPYVKSAVLVSREQGVSEMKELLGEDFLDVFETSPIPVSLDLTLRAEYVSADSLDVIRVNLEESPLVGEVVYQRALVDKLNSNLGKVSMVIGVFVLLLLFISFVLINNTVRLNIYSRRFTIHTMRLVGATKRFIRGPFLVQAVFQGLFAGLVASLLLLGIMFVIRTEFAQLFAIFSMELLLAVIGIVLACGVVICLISTFFVVNKLISLRKSELYY
ncbi:MAG: permease-like cell division protein FtsX [Bacteroidales bacterium]|nr:permease-like cell division protein FtsX [Bacteroidales bacterium]